MMLTGLSVAAAVLAVVGIAQSKGQNVLAWAVLLLAAGHLVR